jgi:hypothetical protein
MNRVFLVSTKASFSTAVGYVGFFSLLVLLLGVALFSCFLMLLIVGF